MNEPIDDNAFEEYLKRGSPVSQHYQALDSDEIPADIDRQVLARAQEAVRAPVARKTRAWQRWSVPVALAASTVLAVSIVIEGGQHESTLTRAPRYPAAEQEAPVAVPQTDERESVPTLAYEPPRPVGAPAAPTEGARAGSASQDRPADSARAQVERSSEPRAAVAPRLEAFAKRAEADAERKASTDARVERARRSVAEDLNDRAMQASRTPVHPVPPAPPPAEVQQAAPVASAAQAESSSFARERHVHTEPEEWLREIRELRASGKAEEADREWKAFREAFPDHVVAEDDLAIGR